MTFNQWLKQAKKNTKIIERIESIKYADETGAGVSWDDLAFLQSQQDFIKKTFSGDAALWELAGIPESEFNKIQKA